MEGRIGERRGGRTILAGALVAAALAAGGGPARAQDGEGAAPRATAEEAEEPRPSEVFGRLDQRRGEGEGDIPPVFLVEVGRTTYLLAADGDLEKRLHRLRGKHVVVRGDLEPAGEGAVRITPRGEEPVEALDRESVLGTVRAVEEGGFALDPGEGPAWRIDDRDARKVRPFAGKHVAVEAHRVADASFRLLESVKSVERRLLPGEREPSSPEEALAGKWEGTLKVVEVPANARGVEAGDYAVRFTTDARQRETSGRLMDTYDIKGVRVRKYDPRTRSLEFEITYSFDRGGFALSMTGVFAEDWKSLEGDWKSGFVGSGTFRLEFRE